ncbi:MAG: hypothetical protein ACT4O9_02060 [Blastocatellia bacterium]
MKTRILQTAVITAFSLAIISCAAGKQPSSPLQTLQTYQKALKQKDSTTMKLLLSSETIKMHEQEAKSQGVTVDEIVKRETLFSESQKTVEFRNEKIEGEKATLEVRGPGGSWETVPFVLEGGEWKIDKKGYADQLMKDIELNNQQIDNVINQGRQPLDLPSDSSNSSDSVTP